MPCEIEMLPCRERLVGKDQHRVTVESLLDRGDILCAERPREIDVADFCREILGDWPELRGHGVVSLIVVRWRVSGPAGSATPCPTA